MKVEILTEKWLKYRIVEAASCWWDYRGSSIALKVKAAGMQGSVYFWVDYNR